MINWSQCQTAVAFAKRDSEGLIEHIGLLIDYVSDFSPKWSQRASILGRSYFNLATVYFQIGDTDKSSECLVRAKEMAANHGLNPLIRSISEYEATKAFFNGDFAKAVSIWERDWKSVSDDSISILNETLHYSLAIGYLALGRIEQAEQYWAERPIWEDNESSAQKVQQFIAMLDVVQQSQQVADSDARKAINGIAGSWVKQLLRQVGGKAVQE